MRHRSLVPLALALTLLATPAFAQSTGMANGSANHGTTVARCSPGDPNVMVDTKAKTYTMAAPAAAPKASGSPAGGASDADAMPDAAMGTKSSAMKSMCKSEADSMGATAAAGSASPAP